MSDWGRAHPCCFSGKKSPLQKVREDGANPPGPPPTFAGASPYLQQGPALPRCLQPLGKEGERLPGRGWRWRWAPSSARGCPDSFWRLMWEKQPPRAEGRGEQRENTSEICLFDGLMPSLLPRGAACAPGAFFFCLVLPQAQLQPGTTALPALSSTFGGTVCFPACSWGSARCWEPGCCPAGAGRGALSPAGAGMEGELAAKRWRTPVSKLEGRSHPRA